ncbi:MAG TPA: S-4TM family putative pore-forming effector [Bryobacteraceae bacterium]|jgi:hypothetical protein|nr:S-4TM family putative pore-forming effector [Bryobacteraceae bacterium]
MPTTQNSIPEHQNNSESLSLISGANQLYRAVKRVAVGQIASTVCVPLGFSIVSLINAAVGPWSALYSLLIALVDPLLFDKWQKIWKTQAARLQEQFDCELFGLSWNELICGQPPSAELIHRAANRYRGPSLRDWYPVSVGTLPLVAARLVCQRSSIAWDSELRRRYVFALKIAGAILFASVLVIAFAINLSLQGFIFSVLAPAVPILQWGVKEVQLQQDSLDRLDRLFAYSDRTWREMLAGIVVGDVLSSASRAIQDQLYLHRQSNQAILESLYGFLRRNQEHEMQAVAKTLVEAASKNESQLER